MRELDTAMDIANNTDNITIKLLIIACVVLSGAILFIVRAYLKEVKTNRLDNKENSDKIIEMTANLIKVMSEGNTLFIEVKQELRKNTDDLKANINTLDKAIGKCKIKNNE